MILFYQRVRWFSTWSDAHSPAVISSVEGNPVLARLSELATAWTESSVENMLDLLSAPPAFRF
jgi:hypothetical protein